MKKNDQKNTTLVGRETPSYKQALQSAGNSSSSSGSSNSTTGNTSGSSTTFHSSGVNRPNSQQTTQSNQQQHHHHNRNIHHKSKPTTVSSSTAVGSNQTDVSTTTNTQSAPLLTLDNTDVGNHVVLRLLPAQNILEGEVFAFDPELGFLALFINEGKHASSTRKNFRIIRVGSIAEVVSNTKAAHVNQSGSSSEKFLDTVPFADTSIPLPEVDSEEIMRREEIAIHDRRERLGSNVSSEAQAIFDNLSKTLPCKWRGKDILVMDSVIVPPYGLDNVSGPAAERKRVQNFLQKALEKIKSNKY
ncbi:hypothetical protein C9374_010900 [Naegleria lovaniensis]|uniref:AD domain-containing protein n=1 Tax=Naegleria lovaniensis TaxID=51637 RepID=A0AA88KD14_NAELO|nr:uncharacterized protein C9374_010900 [Naegleria lovaniensis]KAG2374330.1 hypothetical protein C9374_010900 [Naegleria lovaniensis]